MTEIDLEPDVSNCIRTLARREYDRALKEILSSDPASVDLCQKAETLRIFLESTDFAKVRSQYEPYLAQGRRVTFTLRLAGNGAEYRMVVR